MPLSFLHQLLSVFRQTRGVAWNRCFAAKRLCLEPLERREMLTTLPGGFSEVLITDELTLPTAMDIAPDGRIFVAEAAGEVLVIKDNALLPTPFLHLHDIFTQGEHGLVGMTLDPDFVNNGYVYVYYTVEDSPIDKHNRVSRFTANGDVAIQGSELVLLDLEPLNNSQLHNGGAMEFGDDGKLYIGVGMNADVSTPQSLDTRLGKILRIDPDGSIPQDNPFYATATGDHRAIYALGVRNPFSMDSDPSTGRIFFNDVGAASWEEINKLVAGGNYGWPAAEGEVGNPAYEDPLYTYPHGFGPGEGCAITGGAFYSPATQQFPADYAGDYFFVDFCSGAIQRYDATEDAVYDFATDIGGQSVQLAVDEGGSLFYLSRADSGLYRIDKPGDFPPSIILQPASQAVGVTQPVTFRVSASGSGPISYQWQRNGADVSGATSPTYTIGSTSLADDGASFRAVVTNSFGSDVSDAAILTVINSQLPMAVIDTPLATLTYDAGDTIAFSGTGTDPEDGNLSASAFTWSVDFHHDAHFHPVVPSFSGATSGSFQIPTTGETSPNVWYRIHLTVTDSDGLTDSTFRDVFPNTSLMTFTSNLPGIALTLDGAPINNPSTKEGVVNVQRTLGASTPQTINGEEYQFVSWSDGAAEHIISTPAVDTNYVATFAPRQIDNGEAGYQETGGQWEDGPDPGNDGSSTRRSNDALATATWTPLLGAGLHHVSIYKVASAENTAQAQVTIQHAGQIATRDIDLSQGPSGWVYLGQFEFDGSGGENVSIVNGAAGYLVADAVEFHNGDGLDEGLVAYWSFNEGSGQVAADTSPFGLDNPATLVNGAFFGPTGIGGAVAFGDADQYVSVADTTDINLENYEQFTVALWFNAEDTSVTSQKQVLYKQGGSGRGLNIYLHDGRLYVAAWNEDDPNWAGTFLSTDQITSNQWHHVAITIDGDATLTPDAIVGYLDGKSFASGEGTMLRRHAGNISLGRTDQTTRFHDGPSAVNADAFAGQIDEAHIYQRTLTAQQVEFLAQVSTPASEDSGLVAYWAFSEGAGSSVADTSPEGNDNSAPLSGDPQWDAYGIQGSLLFDGDGDYVNIADTTDINLSHHNQLTIALWFRAADASISDSKQVLYEQGGTGRGMSIYVHDGRLYVGVWNSAVAGWDGTYLSTDQIQSGQWHHVALVLDGQQTLQPDALKAYLDGSEFGSGEATRWVKHKGDVAIGRNDGKTLFHDGVSAASADGFTGNIDDVRVYQRALPVAEVGFLANQPLLTAETELYAYWSFDEGSGSVAGDTAPLGEDNSGTLSAGAGWMPFGLNGALTLDGIDGRVIVADSPDLNTANHDQLTVSLWFQADDVSLASRKQVLYEQGGTGRGLSIYLFDGRLYAGAWNDSAGWSGTFHSTDQVASGQWHYVTLVIDGDGTLQPDVVAAYLDGSLIDSGQGVGWRQHGGDIGVGRVAQTTRFHDGNSAVDGDGFAGQIDELRVYHRRVSDAEIQAMAAAELRSLDSDLVAHLELNETSGTTAADSSPLGNDNSATLQGDARFVAGGINGAVQLDGDGDYLDIPDSTDINLSRQEQLTIALWFQADNISVSTRKQVIYEQGGSGRGLNIYLDNGQLYVGAWTDNVAGWSQTYLSTTQINSGQWHHVALVLDAGSTAEPDGLTAYLDGVAFASGLAARYSQHGGDIGIGRVDGKTRFHDGISAVNGDGLEGFVDDFRYYRNSLTAGEIAYLHAVLFDDLDDE